MGTATIFKRLNDLHGSLADMTKEELEKIDGSSPYSSEKLWLHGWSIEMELHTGNVEPLVWWKGRLMRLRDAPKLLTKKYYNKYSGKYSPSSEWTMLKKYLQAELEQLDKEFKRIKRREYRSTEKP